MYGVPGDENKLTEFDFFMDEDVRARRIGILCSEKTLTPALTQALFRVKESAHAFHEKRIKSLGTDKKNDATELTTIKQQIREVKWSELNLMRSHISIDFLYNFFANLPKLDISVLKNPQNSNSIFFLDTFTSAHGYRFEEKVRNSNNLSRCFRIDSRAHDIMQMTDLLLGITVFKKFKKKTASNAKTRVIHKFDELFLSRRMRIKYDCIHEIP